MSRAAIIVAGGAARRLGGVAKPWLDVRGIPIIDHVISAALPHVQRVVVVGTPPTDWPIPDRVLVTVEDPPGGGPVVGIRTGLHLVDDAHEVLLLAGDAPFVEHVLMRLLLHPMRGDGVAAEHDGHVQFLCARIVRSALQRALSEAGASMHSVFDHLQIDTIEAEVRDADTWEDVAGLRAKNGAIVSDNAWLDEVAAMVGTDTTIDIDAVLALARDVAHNVERKNAPLSAYYLGFAAAARGLNQAQIAELAAIIGARAKELGAANA